MKDMENDGANLVAVNGKPNQLHAFSCSHVCHFSGPAFSLLCFLAYPVPSQQFSDAIAFP